MRNTPNYNLPQYDGTDKFTKEVLNDAFSKIDLAIDDLQETFNTTATGGAITTQEVINARNGKENLKERIDEIDEQYNEIANNKIPQLQGQLEDIAIKLIANNTDDSNTFKSIKSGNKYILESGKEYFIKNVWLDNINNIEIDGRGATINVIDKISHGILFKPNCYNIKIKNCKFKGKSDGTTDTVALDFLSVDDNYSINSACKNIEIDNCEFLGKFTVSILANVVTGLKVSNCFFTSNTYLGLQVGTGGYGVLTQTCYDITIENNKFIGTTTDRHAIYISCFSLPVNIPQRNKNLKILNNFIDWQNVDAGSKHENAISLRSCENVLVDGNTILGGFGGILVNPSHDNIYNVTISNNKILGVKETNSDLHGIGSILGDKGYNFKVNGLYILNNIITSLGDRTQGITITGTSDFLIENNTINVATNCIDIMMGVDGFINGNKLTTSNSGGTCGISFRGGANFVSDNVRIGNNKFANMANKTILKDNSSPTNISYGFNISFDIAANGTGGINVSNDFYRVVESIVPTDYGCDITFNALVKPKQGIFTNNVTYGGAMLSQDRGVVGQKLMLAFKKSDGGNLDLRSNAITSTCFINAQ